MVCSENIFRISLYILPLNTDDSRGGKEGGEEVKRSEEESEGLPD